MITPFFSLQPSCLRFCALVILGAANLSILSCDPFLDAPPEKRIAMVKQEILNNNREFLKELGSSGTRARGLLESHPGAPWFVGLRLRDMDLKEEAASLFVRQIMAEDPVYAHFAFRDWLGVIKSLPEGRALLRNEGFDLFSRLDRSSFLHADTAKLFVPLWLDALESDGRNDEAFSFALSMLGNRGAAELTGQVGRPLGEPPIESWILFHIAANGQDNRGGNTEMPLVYEAFAAYCLAFEARLGHGQIALLRQSGMSRWFSPGMMGYVAAKDALVKGRAAQALEGFAAIAGNPSVLDAEFALPLVLQTGRDALVKDVYVASRQAGKTAKGTEILLTLADWFGLREPVLAGYAFELAGRLQLQDGLIPRSRTSLGKALAAPLHPTDRNRVVWYLIQTHLEEAGANHGRLVDRTGFLKALWLGGPDGFFTDIQEDCIALLARTGDYGGLEELFSSHLDTLELSLQYRLAFLLALKSGAHDPLEPHLAFLLSQNSSVYYYAMARWLAGLPVDLEAFLARTQKAPDRAPDAGAAPVDQTRQIQAAARGFVDMDMLVEAYDFAWTWRRNLDSDFTFAVIGALQQSRRYRDAQRLADSVRLRLGHPADKEKLRLMYPWALPDQMSAALAGLGVPQSLWYGLIRTESAFDLGAKSRVGARGLSQLMPDTAAETASRYGVVGNPDDPDINLRLGALYLESQFTRFKSWPHALCAYNAGPGRMREWLKEEWAQEPWSLAEQSPFAETRNYVRRIVESALLYDWLYSPEPDTRALLAALMRQY